MSKSQTDNAPSVFASARAVLSEANREWTRIHANRLKQETFKILHKALETLRQRRLPHPRREDAGAVPLRVQRVGQSLSLNILE
jgi:hypothetical protein